MKLLLASIFLFTPLLAAPQDEILILEELIETTKKNLDTQQQALKILIAFKDAREAFIANPDSGKLATALVKRAIRLYNLIEDEHLAHLFSQDFLMEIAFYNQVGKQVARER